MLFVEKQSSSGKLRIGWELYRILLKEEDSEILFRGFVGIGNVLVGDSEMLEYFLGIGVLSELIPRVLLNSSLKVVKVVQQVFFCMQQK